MQQDSDEIDYTNELYEVEYLNDRFYEDDHYANEVDDDPTIANKSHNNVNQDRIPKRKTENEFITEPSSQSNEKAQKDPSRKHVKQESQHLPKIVQKSEVDDIKKSESKIQEASLPKIFEQNDLVKNEDRPVSDSIMAIPTDESEKKSSRKVKSAAETVKQREEELLSAKVLMNLFFRL
jgi:hypothetical protein